MTGEVMKGNREETLKRQKRHKRAWSQNKTETITKRN